MKTHTVLLLSGSHRGKKTTTNAILDYVGLELSKKNIVIFREQVPSAHSNTQSISHINHLLLKCDTIVLCFPLYFDSLPFPLISTLETLVPHNQSVIGRKMLTIIHCGLPEANHCMDALAICKNFAEKMGLNYAGSVIIPDTGSIDGSPVNNCKRIRSILDELIMNISDINNIGNDLELIGKPSMHPIFFRIFGNMIMKFFARKNKANIFQKAYDF